MLSPTDRVRYSPGSLLMVVSPDARARDEFLARVVEEKGAILSAGKVRQLLAGRVAEDDLAARADEVLEAAVRKRIQGGEAVILGLDGAEAAERERWVRIAAPLRRPRHLILLDATGGEDAAALGELRRALMAGDLGGEGFNTAMRLAGSSVGEVKRIVFRPPPQDD